MLAVPKIEPVSRLQRDWRALADQLATGPIVLSNQGRAAAVLVSVDEWDRAAERLAHLERQLMGDQAVAADQWVAAGEVGAQLARIAG